MKTAHHQVIRKWPINTGLKTYNFNPPRAEITRLHSHIGALESRLEHQATIIQQLAEKVSHDPLTGLLNRPGMERALGHAITNYQRYGHHGALLMIDLNHFKKVNDTYGHAAGDALLQLFAKALQRNTRSTDALCRLGGDEFLVFLMEANLSQSLTMVRRLRRDLEENPLIWSGQTIIPSLSVGIATLEEAPYLPGLVELADSRMYRLKQALKSARE